MSYAYREGARQKLSAQVVGEALEQIRQANSGALTPEDVVAAARPKSHPLHDGFEWNNTRAADQYRLVQAREMIRAVVVVPDAAMGENVPPTVRAFVIVGDRPNQVYNRMYDVMSDEEKREQLLQRALRELRQWRERYRDLEELAAIFSAMDQRAA